MSNRVANQRVKAVGLAVDLAQEVQAGWLVPFHIWAQESGHETLDFAQWPTQLV